MPNTIEELKAFIKTSKEQIAVIAEGDDEKAYNRNFVSSSFRHYTPDAYKPTLHTKLNAQKDPVERFTTLSRKHLRVVEFELERTLQEATASLGVVRINEVIAAVSEACDIRNLELHHTPTWPGSSYSTDDSLDKIKATKALKSPMRLGIDSDAGMISLGVTAKNYEPDPNSAHFLIRNFSKRDMQRSAATLHVKLDDGKQDFTTIVGGNHLQAAWIAATVTKLLQRELRHRRIEPLAEQCAEEAKLVVREIKVPQELSLVGQRLVENGQESIIEARVSRKTAPKGKNLEPGSDDLKRKGRKRGEE